MGPLLSFGEILINQSLITDNLVIGCYSTNALTLSMTSFKKNTTSEIAKCERYLKTCFLSNAVSNQTFSITHFSGGALLTVNNLNIDLCGTYMCCESFTPTNCGSTIVHLPDSTTTSIVPSSSKHNLNNDTNPNGWSNDAHGNRNSTGLIIAVSCTAVVAVVSLILTLCAVIIMRPIYRKIKWMSLEREIPSLAQLQMQNDDQEI
ncbi:hypothetical protein DPMN_174975 [Dreissena polymorpha]|uniref:Uncharacterized protein n=2 Tax=Dreissena polymorpha TaxID=45954 RepID=A0A9D4IJ40_DREPO|nr:hypothetical protein DPMN_174975 [Dreissena polymorpha]